MALTVNRADVRRFITWIEPADWIPCLWGWVWYWLQYEDNSMYTKLNRISTMNCCYWNLLSKQSHILSKILISKFRLRKVWKLYVIVSTLKCGNPGLVCLSVWQCPWVGYWGRISCIWRMSPMISGTANHSYLVSFLWRAIID